MKEKKTYLTQEGLDELKKELDDLINVQRPRNIIAIKEASPSLEKALKLMNAIKFQKLDFSLICGNDTLTIPFLSIGGIGTISVFANLMPNIMHEICLGERDLFFKYYAF